MALLRSNIGRAGRVLRGVMGVFFLVAAIVVMVLDLPRWLVAGLVAGGLFALFEAAAGWCAARACGIRTKI